MHERLARRGRLGGGIRRTVLGLREYLRNRKKTRAISRSAVDIERRNNKLNSSDRDKF